MIQLNLIIKFIIFLFVSSCLASILYLLPYLLNYNINTSSEKLSPYECGFEPFNDSRGSFNVHFYIVGILFVIFDLEIVYLLPWSKTLYIIGFKGFWVGIVFLAALTVGFIYEWKKGALSWSKNFYKEQV